MKNSTVGTRKPVTASDAVAEGAAIANLARLFFEIGSEDDEEDHVRRQHVGHDPEHAVALVEDAGAEFGKGVPGVRDEFGRVLPEDVADHPAGQLDPQQNTRHGDPLVELRLGADPVVDGFEIPHPVADAGDGSGDQQVVADPAQPAPGPVEEEHENAGDDDVDAAVELRRGRVE